MVSVVIVAGGKGKRMKSSINKVYIKLLGREILARTIDVFEKCKYINEIIIVTGRDEIDYCKNILVNKYAYKKVKDVIVGGKERQNSVYNGLLSCSKDTNIVVIHDGARPFVTENMIKNSIECTEKFTACAVGVKVKDTIKIVDDDNNIVNTPDRSFLYAVQTPQTFKYDVILKAHKYALDNNIFVTDDTSLVESLGYMVKMIEGSYSNIKITTPEDLIFGEGLMKSMK